MHALSAGFTDVSVQSQRKRTDRLYERLKKAIDNPAVEVVQCKTVEELVRNIIRNCKGEVIL